MSEAMKSNVAQERLNNIKAAIFVVADELWLYCSKKRAHKRAGASSRLCTFICLALEICVSHCSSLT